MKSLIIKQIPILVFLFLFLSSCVYRTDELTEIDVQKTNPSQPVNVILSPEVDSIIIYSTTTFSFDVNTFGKKFAAAQVRYFDYGINFQTQKGSFSITPNMYDEKYANWFDVSIDFYIATGTGSIADQLGLENYSGTKVWKVKYINLRNYDFKFNHRVGQDSLLELYWIKPPFAGADIMRNNSLKITRIKSDTVFYTDSAFAGGWGSQHFYLYLGNSFENFYSVEFNYPKPEVTITDIDFDSCLISWSGSPFKMINQLTNTTTSDYKLLYSGTKTSFKDAQPPIGATRTYDLKCFSFNEKQFESYMTKHHFWPAHSVGTKIRFSVGYASQADKFFLSYNNSDGNSLETSGFPLVYRETPEEYRSYLSYMASTPSGNLKVTTSYSLVNVYDESNTKINSFQMPNQSADFPNLTQNGLFSYFFKKFYIRNLNPDRTWDEFSFSPHYNDSTGWNYVNGINVTDDGNYVSCRGDYEFMLYDISDRTIAKEILRTKTISVMISNPVNVKEVVCLKKDRIEVCSLPEMTTLRTFDTTGMDEIIFQNIDPYSEILMFTAKGLLVFVDINTMKEVMRLPAALSWSNNNRLYRKQLFLTRGYMIDLTKYLP